MSMVNTFLPYPNYYESAEVLDMRRLGKQRVETLQLLNANLGLTVGWRNHPCAVMWRNHDGALAMYGVAICKVWTDRGYKDTVRDKLLKLIDEHDLTTSMHQPRWLGNEQLHLSHQSNLVRKDPIYYRQYFPDVSDNLPYLWLPESFSEDTYDDHALDEMELQK
jgi:hypothetical protein